MHRSKLYTGIIFSFKPRYLYNALWKFQVVWLEHETLTEFYVGRSYGNKTYQNIYVHFLSVYSKIV